MSGLRPGTRGDGIGIEMTQRLKLNETQVMDGSGLFKMNKTDATTEIADHIFEFKVYARHNNLTLLAHLLSMAEIEARQAADDAQQAARPEGLPDAAPE